MTIDLSTARVGSEVTTHAGAKLVISETYPTDHGCLLVFEGYTVAFLYLRNGHRAARVSPDPMQIIAISPPPMSDAERLEEIAKMLLDFPMPDIGDMYFSIHATKWNVLLALAKGRAP